MSGRFYTEREQFLKGKSEADLRLHKIKFRMSRVVHSVAYSARYAKDLDDLMWAAHELDDDIRWLIAEVERLKKAQTTSKHTGSDFHQFLEEEGVLGDAVTLARGKVSTKQEEQK